MAKPATDKSYLLEADEVRNLAQGHWAMIYEKLTPQLSKQLERPFGKHGPCPVHGSGKDPSVDGFRFFPHELGHMGNGGGICNSCGAKGDGFKVLQWMYRWSFPETLQQVYAALGYRLQDETRRDIQKHVKESQVATRPESIEPLFDVDKARKLYQRLRSTWEDSVPLTDPTATWALNYFKARGLVLTEDQLPADMRLHPRLVYRDLESKQVLGFFPTLITVRRDVEGQVASLHRTYLSKKGRKANVPIPKLTMPVLPFRKTMGGAMRLYSLGSSRRLHVTEGIENALAVRMILDHDEPVWPTGDSAHLAGIEPPTQIKEVWFWGDKDRKYGGQEAVNTGMNRLCQHGIKCRNVLPPIPIPEGQKSVDFRDMVQEFGADLIRKSDFFKVLRRAM